MSNSNNDKPKTLLNEKLPDPTTASSELSRGDPRSRTAAHLKRIITASLVVPVAAGVASCQVPFQVVDPVPPPVRIPQAVATLSLKTPTSGTMVVDAAQAVVLTPGTRMTLTGGAHKVEVAAANYTGPFVVEITVGNAPPPNVRTIVSGTLKVLATADVKVDDTPSVRMTPESSLQLAAGAHTIEFKPVPNASSLAFTIDIKTVTQ